MKVIHLREFSRKHGLYDSKKAAAVVREKLRLSGALSELLEDMVRILLEEMERNIEVQKIAIRQKKIDGRLSGHIGEIRKRIHALEKRFPAPRPSWRERLRRLWRR